MTIFGSRKLSHQELVQRQKQQRSSTPAFCALLNNVRSLYNVGSIFRTADGIGLEKLWLCGITGIPPDSQISKTALGAEKTVPWEYRETAVGALRELKGRGYKIVLLEQTVDSIPYQKFKPQAPICLVMGHEVEGISEELLPLCDKAVEIEMAGLKNSLNVAVAFGIVGYHILNRLRR